MKTGLTCATIVAVLLAVGVGWPRQPGLRAEQPLVAGPELTPPDNAPTAPALVPLPLDPEPRGILPGRYRGSAPSRPVARPSDGDAGAPPPLPEDAGDWDGPGAKAEQSLSEGPRLEHVPPSPGLPWGPLSPMPKPAASPEKPQANKSRLGRLGPFGPRDNARDNPPAGLRLPFGRGSGFSLGPPGRGDRGSSVNGLSKGLADPLDSTPAKSRRTRGESRQRTASQPQSDPNAPGRR